MRQRYADYLRSQGLNPKDVFPPGVPIPPPPDLDYESLYPDLDFGGPFINPWSNGGIGNGGTVW